MNTLELDPIPRTRSARRLVGGAGMVALLMSAACGQQPPAPTTTAAPTPGDAVDDRDTLTLVEGPTEDGARTVDLVFHARHAQQQPRLVAVKMDLGGARYVSARTLGLAEAQDKKVIAHEGPDGRLQLLILSTTNTTRIASGPLARVVLQAAGGEKIALVDKHPLLAPADAEAGATVGQPIILGGR